jgi:hypothetical protein
MSNLKPVVSAESVRRLTLSRYYLTIAKEHARSDRELDSFLAINLLQEALETFLIAASQQVNATLKPRTDFVGYLDKIDEAIAPNRLPFRTTLIRLNKARVQAKHDSLVLDRTEIPNFVVSAGSFLDEATNEIFGLDFSTVSLIDLIDTGDVREHLFEAQQAYDEGSYSQVLISCRRALYLLFERSSDISIFENGEPGGFLAVLGCTAPQYARSQKYVVENVLEPFDYIVLDHSRLDSEMIKDGLDPHIFWNLWRLTPQVYKPKQGDWMVKNEPDKLSETASNENAGYVLENTVELIYRRQRKRLAIRMVQGGRWQLEVKTIGAAIYKKASKESEIIANIPFSVKHVQVQSGTPSLTGDGYFWRIFRNAEMEGDNWYIGYVHQDDLIMVG